MSQWVDNNNAEWVFDDAEGWGPFNADETGKLISIASTVSIIDTQAYKDLERLISIASTVSATDLQAYKELEMLISIISTISAGDAIFHNETGRLIPIASDVSVTDLQTYKDIVNIPIASTVSV
ncbi:hypothetical protein KA005_15135, partial [bacterium]|nr:hypothetical protein [bacterium]